MTEKETKLSEDEYIPASLRIPEHLDFDSCLEHVNYNIEKLSKIATTKGEAHPFEILNYVVPIITNVCRLVDKPARNYENDTFCLQTRLESCHQEDIEKLKSELKNIQGNDIYAILKNARNNTVAHTNSAYEGYKATQKALEEVAYSLIDREYRLKKLVSKIKYLIHNVEMSIRKKEGKQLNADTFTIQLHVPKK